MGGWLNPCHPLFRIVDWWSGGAYEAFLERMLLGVMLVRDVVEKSRWVDIGLVPRGKNGASRGVGQGQSWPVEVACMGGIRLLRSNATKGLS